MSRERERERKSEIPRAISYARLACVNASAPRACFSFQSLNFEQSSGNLSLAARRGDAIIAARDGTIFRKSTKKARYRDFVLLKAGYERSHAAQIAQQLISLLSAALGGSRRYWQSA